MKKGWTILSDMGYTHIIQDSEITGQLLATQSFTNSIQGAKFLVR